MEAQQQKRPVVKLVTPVAQAIETAKSEIERERKKEGGEKRKKTYIPPLLPKRLKHYAYNPEDQLQSKKISNDQELIQSDPISCPQNQKGNN